MSTRFVLIAVLAAGLAIGTTTLIDVLIVTDEELIEKFIDDVTGEVGRELIDRSLGYVALERLPPGVRVR